MRYTNKTVANEILGSLTSMQGNQKASKKVALRQFV